MYSDKSVFEIRERKSKSSGRLPPLVLPLVLDGYRCQYLSRVLLHHLLGYRQREPQKGTVENTRHRHSKRCLYQNQFEDESRAVWVGVFDVQTSLDIEARHHCRFLERVLAIQFEMANLHLPKRRLV